MIRSYLSAHTLSRLLSPSDRVSRWRARTVGWASVAGIVAVLFVWQLGRIHLFQFSNDEGIILMWTRMARAGYPLYSATWVDQPPGLMVLLMGAFALFGESVTVARVLNLLIAALGLVGVGLTAREAGGWIAAIAAVAALGLAPRFAWYSRAVMQDVPALSMASLALGLGLIHRRTAEQRWLWLSGSAFGFGMLIKPVVAPLAAPIGLVLLVGHRDAHRFEFRGITLDALQWVLAAVVPVVLVLAAFDLRSMARLVLGAILEARDAYSWSLEDNLTRFGELAVEGNLGLIALAAIGVVAVLRRTSAPDRSQTARWALLIWAVVAAAGLLAHTPLYAHHLIMVLMPLAGLAGVGASHIARALGVLESSHSTATRRRWMIVGVLVAAVYLGSMPSMVRAYTDEISRFEPLKWQALDKLHSVTDPGDFIVTDMGTMAFRGGLLTPPNIVDMGSKRVESGLLTEQDILEATFAYPVQAVVFWTSRQRLVPGFAAWVDHNYYHLFRDGASRHIYVPVGDGPIVRYASPSLQVAPTAAVDPQPLPVQFDEGVSLLGYTLAQSWAGAGEAINFTLLWQAREPMRDSFKVFTHLIDTTDIIWGQKDNLPVKNRRPTDSWLPGELIVDNYTIPVDPTVPPGRYILEVGMYSPDTGERLPVLGPNGQPIAGRVLLEPISVE